MFSYLIYFRLTHVLRFNNKSTVPIHITHNRSKIYFVNRNASSKNKCIN